MWLCKMWRGIVVFIVVSVVMALAPADQPHPDEMVDARVHRRK